MKQGNRRISGRWAAAAGIGVACAVAAGASLGWMAISPQAGSEQSKAQQKQDSQPSRPWPLSLPYKKNEKTWVVPARPIDFVIDAPLHLAFVTSDSGLFSIDLKTGGQIRETTGGLSAGGAALSPDGSTLAVSTPGSKISLYSIQGGRPVPQKDIDAAQIKGKTGSAYPCGLVFSPDGKTLYAALSLYGEVGAFDVATGKLTASYSVPPAPFGIGLTRSGSLFVTCWGAVPKQGEDTEKASGVTLPVNVRGIEAAAEVASIDLKTGTVKSARCDLLPSKPLIVGDRAYVPCANADCIDIFNISTMQQQNTWKIDRHQGFGISPNGMIALPNNHFAVACGGDNSVRILDDAGRELVRHASPMYPMQLGLWDGQIVVACTKGLGSRYPHTHPGYSVHDSQGTLSLLDTSPDPFLKPIAHTGSLPTAIKHVIYVIKENRTYDQVFGDAADGDPQFAIFGKKVTPNQHALADRFGLLTRYFCDSIISTDGHAWSTEANSTAELERSFGGWTRSYPWGDDPIAITKSGAIWDDALEHGKSFRNYGEYVYATPTSATTFLELLKRQRAGKPFTFTPKIVEKRLWKYSDHHYPGWGLTIPDQVRADEFARDFKSRPLADFTLVYIEQDHTSGGAAGQPTPRAMNADDDLALGRIVDTVSHSKYWKSTAIFMTEDDPQNGFDHIDGHRSVALVISPWSNGGIIRTPYDQPSLLHTIELLLHIPPMTRFDANALPMYKCFTNKPNFKPFNFVPATYPLTEMNGSGVKSLDFSQPDIADEDALNRQIWHSVFPYKPYPAAAGQHGDAKHGAAKHGKSQSDDDDD